MLELGVVLACVEDDWGCEEHGLGVVIVRNHQHIFPHELSLALFVSIWYCYVMLRLTDGDPIDDIGVRECVMLDRRHELHLTVFENDIVRFPGRLAGKHDMHVAQTCVADLLKGLVTLSHNLLCCPSWGHFLFRRLLLLDSENLLLFTLLLLFMFGHDCAASFDPCRLRRHLKLITNVLLLVIIIIIH